jgi:poly(A) polymerase
MENLWNSASIQIYKALDGQVRLIGGCVRDFLCRRPINDRDMATPLTPDEVEKKLAEAGIDFISIGKSHGTITAKIGGKPYEITTLRKDDKSDGRHAVVTCTTSYRRIRLVLILLLMLCRRM